MTATASCLAPAKLNLFLHVVGRRPDGYHLLQTLFRFLDFGDELTISVRDDPTIRRINPIPGVPADRDLAVRAARLLQETTGIGRGTDIQVDKKLPIGGGLGGGSSDAATTLIVLNRLWETGLQREQLQQLALALGADVPVFLFGRSAFAGGIGERLTSVDLPPAWYLVLVPPVAVSTATVFADRELTRDSKPIKMRGFSAWPGRNDLESVTCRLWPQVREHLDWLRQFGPAGMTGSGGCVFGAFETESAAMDVFRRRPVATQGFVARGLDRHPLWDWVS